VCNRTTVLLLLLLVLLLLLLLLGRSRGAVGGASCMVYFACVLAGECCSCWFGCLLHIASADLIQC
jgi:hypothetical protein